MGRFGPWKDALALALLAAAAVSQGTKQSAPGEIERLCDDLRQAGPEARAKRRLAAERLLGMREPRAHEAIVAAIGVGEDADYIAQSLLVKLQNPADPVFGSGASGASGGEARAKVLPIYVDVAVRTVGGFVTAREPAAQRARAERLRSILLALRPNERRELFAGMLAAGDGSGREHAILAAGECRDLALAFDVAKAWRERPELADAARTALRRLLFLPSLATVADADGRIAECAGKTYLELAEQAARGTASGDGARSARLVEQVTALRSALLAALLAQPKIDWGAVAQHALADDPPGGLDSLREHLRRLGKAPGEAQGRAAFVREALTKRLRTDGEASRAALLECAALLVAPGEAELEAAVVPALVENLASTQPAMREAALLGIARHPSPAARPRIVGLLRRALETRDRPIASASLTALTSQGSLVPTDAAEAVVWLDALEAALKAEFLDTKERSQAVAAITLRDEAGKGVPGAFALLGRVVTDLGLPVWLREQALAQVAALAQPGPESERAVGQLVGILADAEPRLRSQAAALLGKLPAEAWQPVTSAFLRDRLCRETDEDVLKALLECAKLRFSLLADKEPVLRMLQTALEASGGGSDTRPLEAAGALRRALLANGLATLAATRGVAPGAWIGAGECLIKLGERDRVRLLLGSQLGATAMAEVAPDLRARLAWLVIETAKRKPAEAGWAEAKPEAEQVVQAFEILEAQKQDASASALVALRLCALLAQDRSGEAVQLLRKALTPARREPIAEPLGAAGAQVARGLLLAGDAKGALSLYAEVDARLAPEQRPLAELELVRIEAQFALGSQPKGDLLQELEALSRSLPGPLQDKAQSLRRKIQEAPG